MRISDRAVDVALLTGSADKPYAFGLATALMSQGVCLDLIAGDELNSSVFHGAPTVNFLNLRGNQKPADLLGKVSRVFVYYVRLIRYALTAKPKLFHILWNNKFEAFDRTLLTLYYKALGKKIILTAHNINVGRRDATDTALQRLTLWIQYQLADHIFVHTDKMKRELVSDFAVSESAITVIPFGINNSVPATEVTATQAKQRFAIKPDHRTILFFGNIAPYKGLEYLVAAFQQLVSERDEYRLMIAGRPRTGSEDYWEALRQSLDGIERGRIIQTIEFISDEETELYFKAADVLILPYTEIFQSGVLFLGYSFGLPAIAADVGSLRDEIVEGKTGFVFRALDAADLARTIKRYFESDLYKDLPNQRRRIRDYAEAHHSWDTVGRMTQAVYAELARA